MSVLTLHYWSFANEDTYPGHKCYKLSLCGSAYEQNMWVLLLHVVTTHHWRQIRIKHKSSTKTDTNYSQYLATCLSLGQHLLIKPSNRSHSILHSWSTVHYQACWWAGLYQTITLMTVITYKAHLKNLEGIVIHENL